MRIYYPSKKVLKDIPDINYDYLYEGFKTFGEVIIDESLNKEAISHVEPGKAIHLFRFDIELDKKYRVTYDCSDFHWYYPEVRQEGDFYFKIHFLKEYYDNPRMYPIGQTVGKIDFIHNLNKLRKMVDEHIYERDLIAIYRTTNYDIRLKAVELLRNSDLNVITALKDFNPGTIRPYAPKEYNIKKLDPYMKHMYDMTRCKFGLALPAVDNSRAWKHTEIMGLGLPLLALDLKSLNPVDDKGCYIEIKNDLSNLIERIDCYNTFDGDRLKIGERGRRYFDEQLSPRGMARNIIEKAQNAKI